MASRIAPTVRVLTRPPTPAPSGPRPPTPDPQSSSQGVIVVGFISCGPEYSAQLINRILDSNAFGSGNLDKTLRIDSDEAKDWFKYRRISYYHEQERGIVYLQFSSKHCPVVHGSFSSVESGFDSSLEEHEFGDLKGMLFMFSACHILIYIQEGSHFDTQILKNFRVLQAAKHAFAPVVRSRPPPPSQSRSRSSSSSRPTISSTNTSPGRRGTTSQNIYHMSGLSSYSSFLPGQCTPVTLFVFIDEFLDPVSSNVEETADVTTSNPAKGAGPVVVLARPVNKSEASFKKKLQSSLEAQIRFLIKKCRILSSIETGGPRSGVISPLFSLDASRVAVLLDRLTNQRGESLEFAISLVEEVLNGKATPDSLLLERHNPSIKDDILSVKEFINRQSDVLRGKGGLVGATSSGSAAAVGMVAVAAAAAAASVAPGKATAAAAASPELPSLELWLSSSKTVFQGILTAKRGCIEENVIRRRLRQHHVIPPQAESTAEPLDIAVSWLERGKGLNTKFSTLWCQKALPSAKDVYLKDLPSCYPASKHKIHLEKALHAFRSMVKGPSVPKFAKILEDECTSIWSSGRQQCDAISLTRKPCIHQRHDSDGDTVQPHSSGYFFLHACACGRSRRLKDDPFDFEFANLTDCFSDCDKILPSLQLLDVIGSGPIKPSAWRLMRVGGSRYYEPSKGLLQSGFSTTEKFLQKWVLYLENKDAVDNFPQNVESTGTSSLNTKMEPSLASGVKKNYAAMLNSSENSRKSDNVGSVDKRNIRFGNFTMKKAFSEVVAGSANSHSEFPPLQQTPLSLSVSNRAISKNSATDRQESRKVQDIYLEQRNHSTKGQTSDPVIRIGSNIISVDAEKITLKHELVYVGFEHECPRGHRFLLHTKYLNELGPFYASSESGVSSSAGVALKSNQVDSMKKGEMGGQDRILSGSGKKKMRNNGKSKGMMVNSNNMLSNESMRNIEDGLSSISLDNSGNALSLLNRNLPLYMNCPHCKRLKTDKTPDVKFAGMISQLQRIFVVTPAFPVTLATSPVIQFAATCVPSPITKEKLRFGLGIEAILPPESFLVLKLPFIYGVQLEDNSNVQPINPFEHQPELTAWICKGTTLWVVSKEKGVLDNGSSKYSLKKKNFREIHENSTNASIWFSEGDFYKSEIFNFWDNFIKAVLLQKMVQEVGESQVNPSFSFDPLEHQIKRRSPAVSCYLVNPIKMVL